MSNYIKEQNLNTKTIGGNQFIITADGNVIITPNSGQVTINGNLKVTGSASGPTNKLVYYVSQEGNDNNDGLSPSADRAKKTIKSAVEAAPPGATIKVAPGNYYENNPITMKERQSIRGDSLRNTNIWPINNQNDIFYVDNACYLFELTFRGLRDPGWCVRIKPGALVTTSPYVQNCSNINGPWLNDGTEFVPFQTVQIDGVAPGSRPIINDPNVPLEKRVNEVGGGNGMLVDGDQYDQRSLIKSMVADAFTQIAQGGIGFHITNFGYTQIVSCFTVFTRTGFMTTNGGYLSISNSVSDFGTYGLLADGLYPVPYTTTRAAQDYYSSVAHITITDVGANYITAPVVVIDPPLGPNGVQATATAVLNTVTKQLDSIYIDNPGSGYTVIPNVTLIGGGYTSPAAAYADLQTNFVIDVNSLRKLPEVGSVIKFDNDPTEYYVTQTNVTKQPFVYDETICRRDVSRIVDAVSGDMALGTNYQSLAAARAYLRATSKIVLQQQLAPTVYALEAARDQMLLRIPDSDPTNIDARYSIIEHFASIINVLEQGDSTSIPDLIYNDLNVDSGTVAAKNNIVANRDFIVNEVTNYLADQFTNLSYNQDKCERDVTLITTAVAYDVVLGTNYNSVNAGKAYLRYSANKVLADQKTVTIASLEYLKSLILGLKYVSGDTTVETRVNNAMNEIIDIINQGNSTSAQDILYPAPIVAITSKINAVNQLRSNRTFIQAEILAWLAVNYPTLTFNAAYCERDVGYIIDAISYDLMYSGNSASIGAAQAYFVGTTSQLAASETDATIAAYKYLQNIVAQIIIGQTINVSVGNTETQVTSGNNGTPVESDVTNSLIQIIIDVLTNNSTSVVPTLVYPDTTWPAQNLKDAFGAIYGDRNVLPPMITDWILANYPSFTYDRSKCKRDVGLIIDAVITDAQLNTNYNSITAGLAYRRGTAGYVSANQYPATILSIRYLQTLLETYVGTQNSTLLSRITNLFDELLAIVEYDSLPSSGLTLPSPPPASQNLINAVRLIQDNKTFLESELVAWTNLNYPALVYDETKCKRDTGYILDALSFDLLYGGNKGILTATRAYFDANGATLINGQTVETAATIEHLLLIIPNIIEGVAITPSVGNTETQVITPGYGTSVESTSATSLLDILVVALQSSSGLLTTPADESPDFSWVSLSIVNLANGILSNKLVFEQDVIDYITNNIIGKTYDLTKCERDTGYVIDAAVYDMMYGGNKQTRRAAEAYYQNAVIIGQEAITEFAYKRLAYLLSAVAQDISVTPSKGTIYTQTITSTPGSFNAAVDLNINVLKIAEVVQAGTYSSLPTEINHSYATIADATLNSKRDIILSDYQAIEDETIKELNFTYGGVAALTLYPGVVTLTTDTLGSMQNVSSISTSGHAFEYVGAGITYNALPFFGGSDIPENQYVESNNGQVFAGGVVDQTGNFKVGQFFKVNALTGGVTINANQLSLQGISSIGPFRRNGIPVGIAINEASDNTNMVASTGVVASDTVPTQHAVATYVENRYLNKITGGTVQGDTTFDANVAIQGGSLTTVASTFNLINDNANIVNIAGGALEVNIGALNVGTTTVRNNTVLSGTLDVAGNTTIIGDVTVTVPSNSQAFNVKTSTNEYITVDTILGQESIVFGSTPKVEIQNTSNSTSPTTGALTVVGGVGIGSTSYIGGDLYLTGTILETSNTTLNLFNANTTTVNAFGAAPNITIGYSGGGTPGTLEFNNDYINFNSVYNLKLPVGTTTQRGPSVTGAVRFNTELSLFEGYDGIAWNTLGGVRDVAGLTYILAEPYPGAGTNTLYFYTGGVDRMNLTVNSLTLDSSITTVGIAGTTESTDPDTGVLIVRGGVGINRNANIRGNLRVYNDVEIDGNLVSYNNATFGSFDSVINTFTVNANANINVWDNTASAFSVKESTNSYINISTANGAEELTIGSLPIVKILNVTSSTSTTNGALTVAGGVGIVENLNVGGNISVLGSTTLGNSPTADTLIVNGTITNNVPDNVANAVNITQSTNSYVAISTTNGSETVTFGTTPKVVISNNTNSTSSTTGALTIAGGAGVAQDFYIGQDLHSLRDAYITGQLEVNGGILTSTASTFDLLNVGVTTLNIGGATSDVIIGSLSGNVTINNNLIVDGNFTVNGSVTNVNSTTLQVDDKNIVLGNVATPSDSTADGGGITLLGTVNKTLDWYAVSGAWTSSEHFDLALGKEYRINNTSVLNSTTLGSGVVNSSLQTLGTISTGVWQGTIINSTYGGTGVNNGGRTITIAGNLTTTGAYNLTLNTTNSTNITLPTSGTLAIIQNPLSQFASTTSAQLASVLSDETGTGYVVFNTSPSFVTSIITSSASFDLLNTNATTVNFAGAGTTVSIGSSSGTTTINNSLVVGGDLTVNGTVTTINSTTLAVEDKNIVLANYPTPTDTIADGGGITLKGTTDKTLNWYSATGAWTSNEDFDLVTGKVYRIGGTSVLSYTNLGASVVNSNLQTVGTINTGVWQGSIINSTYGGTGVNNAGRTITIGGNFVTSGSFDVTLTATGTTNVTLPTSGTLAVIDNPLSQFASTTSAQLASVISDETGTGYVVFNTSPSFVTSIDTSSTTFNLLNTTATTVNAFGAAINVNIGATSGTTTIKTAATVNNGTLDIHGVYINSNQTTFSVFNTNSTTINAFGAATALTIGASTGTTTIKNANVVLDGNLNVNGGSLASSTSTFNLLNSTSTTVNAFGAATAINIGASTGTLTINNLQTVFNSTGSIQVPVGDSTSRPTGGAGMVRYNTTISQFEGYDGSHWNSLGGVRDVAGLTYILAEPYPGAGTNTLYFYTGGVDRMDLSTSSLTLYNSVVARIQSTQSSTSTNTGALTVAGGVGIAENLYVGGHIGGDITIGSSATSALTLTGTDIYVPNTSKFILDATALNVGSVVYPLTLTHKNASGTPTIGIGTGIGFEVQTSSLVTITGSTIDTVAQNVTVGQETFDLVFRTTDVGTTGIEKLRLSETNSTFATDLTVNKNMYVLGILDAAAFRGSIFADDSTEIIDAINNRLTVVDATIGTLALTNALAVSYGGTGVTNFTANGILYGNATSPVQTTAAAGISDVTTSYQILTVTSAVDSTPVWTDTIDGGTF